MRGSEREGAEERQRGWEEAPCEDQQEEEEERGGFSPFQLHRPGSARLDNSGQLKQKEKVMNLALPLFNYRGLIVTADQFHGRPRRTNPASYGPAWPERRKNKKNNPRLVSFLPGDNIEPRELGWRRPASAFFFPS